MPSSKREERTPVWTVLYNPQFLRDVAELPSEIRQRVEIFVFTTLPQSENPLTLSDLERMTGHKPFYKVRFSRFRVGIKLEKKRRTVTLVRALDRKAIYRHFP